MKNLGIYVHFPFCVSKCRYCNFCSETGKENRQVEYIQCLLSEIKRNAKYCNSYKVDTIYMGGGTPSNMFDGAIATVLQQIKDSFYVDKNAEISIECNPNSLTYQKAMEWKQAGVNRVSVGLQTCNDKILKTIGRSHTSADYFNAIDVLKQAGFENINVDLMVGLPKMKLSDVRVTLKHVLRSGVSHVSCYSLILEEGTPLYYDVAKGLVKLPKEEKTLGMYNYVYKVLQENGYHRYEVSNFALKDCECRHNAHTWQMQEYMGFGCASHSFMNVSHVDERVLQMADNVPDNKFVRFHNAEKVDEYIKLVSSGKSPVVGCESLSTADMLEEYIMLSMRLSSGISNKFIKQNYGVDFFETKNAIIQNLIRLKLVECNGDNLYATDLGFTLLNKVILDLVS